MAPQQPQQSDPSQIETGVRIFTKDVDGETRIRRVYSPADETDARFDGFTEDTKATTAAVKSAPKSSPS